jgi:hypothetical protein
MNAITLLTDGTVKAAGLVLRQRGYDPLAHVDDIAYATKAVIVERLPGIMEEWNDAISARMSEGWLRELVNAQCKDLGLAVYDRLFKEV